MEITNDIKLLILNFPAIYCAIEIKSVLAGMGVFVNVKDIEAVRKEGKK